MKWYIAGPMAGMDDRNIRSFTSAKFMLIDRGHQAVIPHDVSPHQHDGQDCPDSRFWPEAAQDGHAVPCYLRGDLKVMLECDAVFFLQGWQNSVGARVEEHVALMCGMPRSYQDHPLPPPIQWEDFDSREAA